MNYHRQLTYGYGLNFRFLVGTSRPKGDNYYWSLIAADDFQSSLECVVVLFLQAYDDLISINININTSNYQYSLRAIKYDLFEYNVELQITVTF